MHPFLHLPIEYRNHTNDGQTVERVGVHLGKGRVVVYRGIDPIVRLGRADQQQMGKGQASEQTVTDGREKMPDALHRTGQMYRCAYRMAAGERVRDERYVFPLFTIAPITYLLLSGSPPISALDLW